jgi:PAS domain S-box-containing protein
LFYLDTQGHYLDCNTAFEDLTGKKIEGIAGKSNDEIGDSWDGDLFNRYNTELSENTGIKKYTGLFHHLDGHISRITVQKSTMITVEGTFAGIIGIVLSSEYLKNSDTD